MSHRILGILLALLAVFFLAERFPRLRTRRTERTLNAVLAAVLLFAIAAVYARPLRQLLASEQGYARTYNVYHYYLGAKYFDELRYLHLYTCSLAADSSEPAVWSQDIPVRDLKTYRLVPREELPDCPVEAFSAARWQELRRDLQELTARTDAHFWSNAVIDKGFNQTPFWVFTARIFTRLVALTDDLATRVLFNLDALLVALSLLLVARAFGARSALLTGIGLVTYFGTYQRLLGNFLQYTWLALLLCAISLWKLKRDAASACCLSLATVLHGFPILLLSGLVARTAQRWLARGKGDGHDREELRRAVSYLALVGGTAALLAALCIPFVGVSAWVEFFRNITLHSRQLVAEPFNIGLKNLVATAGGESLFKAHPYSYSKNYTDTLTSMAQFEELYPVYVLLAALGGVLFVLSVRWARSDCDTFPLTLLFLYLFLPLSPYYYLSLVFIFLLPARESSAAWASQTGLLVLLAFHLRSPFLPSYVSFRYDAHWPSELVLASYLVGVSAWYTLESRHAALGSERAP